MKFAMGILVVLISLPLMILPIIGIPLLIIGVIIIFSGIGSSNAEKTAKATAREIALQVPASLPAAERASNSAADEIRKLDELRKSGLITDEEFQAKKKQVLGV